MTTKLGLWIGTRSVTEKPLHDSGRAMKNSGILLQVEKAAERSDSDLT